MLQQQRHCFPQWFVSTTQSQLRPVIPTYKKIVAFQRTFHVQKDNFALVSIMYDRHCTLSCGLNTPICKCDAFNFT